MLSLDNIMFKHNPKEPLSQRVCQIGQLTILFCFHRHWLQPVEPISLRNASSQEEPGRFNHPDRVAAKPLVFLNSHNPNRIFSSPQPPPRSKERNTSLGYRDYYLIAHGCPTQASDSQNLGPVRSNNGKILFNFLCKMATGPNVNLKNHNKTKNLRSS